MTDEEEKFKGTVHPKLKEENSKLFSSCFSNLDPRQTFSSRFLLLWWVFLYRTSVTPNDSIDKGFVVAHQPSRGRYQCCFFWGGNMFVLMCVNCQNAAITESVRSVRFTWGDADKHFFLWILTNSHFKTSLVIFLS